MAAQQNVDIEAMDWGPGGIEIGSQEAEEAATALVSAAVELNGASAGPSTETQMQQLWRCGELRSTSPSATPLLHLAAALLLLRCCCCAAALLLRC